MTKKHNSSHKASGDPKKTYWLDDSANITRLFRWLFVACIAIGAVDLFYHRHTEFSWEELPNFYGFFGFIAFVAIVWIGAGLRPFLMRDEDYYDE